MCYNYKLDYEVKKTTSKNSSDNKNSISSYDATKDICTNDPGAIQPRRNTGNDVCTNDK